MRPYAVDDPPTPMDIGGRRRRLAHPDGHWGPTAPRAGDGNPPGRQLAVAIPGRQGVAAIGRVSRAAALSGLAPTLARSETHHPTLWCRMRYRSIRGNAKRRRDNVPGRAGRGSYVPTPVCSEPGTGYARWPRLSRPPPRVAHSVRRAGRSPRSSARPLRSRSLRKVGPLTTHRTARHPWRAANTNPPRRYPARGACRIPSPWALPLPRSTRRDAEGWVNRRVVAHCRLKGRRRRPCSFTPK
jgi:hypothetical protein